MSLDIAILGQNGSPKMQVSIDPDDHHRLMQVVGLSSNALLRRIQDYYADAEFSSDEIAALLQEIAVLQEKCRGDNRIIAILNAMRELAEIANSERQPLVAIAD